MILLRILEDNSQLALAGIEDQGNAFKHAFEAGSLLFQMAQTGGGDLIGADPAVGGGDTPIRLHELPLEQALERRIERSFFDLSRLFDRCWMCWTSAYPWAGWRRSDSRTIISSAPGKRSRGGDVFIGYTATGID